MHPANAKNAGGPSEEAALDEKMIELAKKVRSSDWKRHVELPDEVTFQKF